MTSTTTSFNVILFPRIFYNGFRISFLSGTPTSEVKIWNFSFERLPVTECKYFWKLLHFLLAKILWVNSYFSFFRLLPQNHLNASGKYLRCCCDLSKFFRSNYFLCTKIYASLTPSNIYFLIAMDFKQIMFTFLTISTYYL